MLVRVIHQTRINDEVGTIILASQRRRPEENHGDINKQYSELNNSLKNGPGGWGGEERGCWLPLPGSSG